jgi:hypothetical protein
MELLDPAREPRAAHEIAAELRRLELDDSGDHPIVAAGTPVRRRSPWVRVGAPAIGVVLLLLAAWAVGTGALPVGPVAAYPTSRPPTDVRPTAQGRRLVAIPAAHARILDPGGDGTELANADRAIDGRTDSAWPTAVYRGGKHFGNLAGKTGMGVLIDLGAARQVSEVRVVLSARGADFDLRAGSTDSNSPDGYRVVVSRTAADANMTIPVPDTEDRYWLLWITSLPEVGANRYSLAVKEISFAGPAGDAGAGGTTPAAAGESPASTG